MGIDEEEDADDDDDETCEPNEFMCMCRVAGVKGAIRLMIITCTRT